MRAQSCLIHWDSVDCSLPGSSEVWKWKLLSHVWLLATPWDFSGQNTGLGSHSLLQGIFPIQGSNPGLLHCRWILSQVSHKGSPRILEWVAYPFFSGSSWSRNWTRVSCMAGGFFTNWAIREVTAGVLALKCHFALSHLQIWQTNFHCNLFKSFTVTQSFSHTLSFIIF